MYCAEFLGECGRTGQMNDNRLKPHILQVVTNLDSKLSDFVSLIDGDAKHQLMVELVAADTDLFFSLQAMLTWAEVASKNT